MKKKLSYMITIMLAFTLSLALGLFFNSAHADSLPQKDGANKKTTKVTVSNKDVPNAVRKLAEEQYLSRVALLDKASNHKATSYTLGEPFKIYKFNKESDGNYYYPVLNKKGDVVYVVTISPNPSNSKASKQQNNYSINVSPFLSKILNQYKNQKITILTNTKGYFALTEDGKVTLVLKTPRNNEKTYENATESTKPKDLNDFKQTASVTKPTLEYQSTRNEMYAEYVNQLKNFRIRETQGYNSWCAGYTMSALLNATYNTNRYNAESVMRYLHPNLRGHDFQFTGLTSNEMLRFGRSQGRNTQYLNRMTSYNEVDQLTTNNQGIAVLGKRVESSDGIHAGHAMAVAGNAKVNNGQEVILIWNPWDNGFMTQDAHSNIIPVSNGDHYEWYASIYGY
ncbi:MAG: cysteine protease staphopain [Staphylococcus epidermidis]|nr:cysteine protease staphopain [Staphylococcus epidermidis]